MFGADARTGIAMFQAITSGVARMDVLRAAAETRLKDHPRHLSFYEAVILYMKPAVKTRNDIAHNIWGTCEELPNALLLTDPKVWASYALDTIEHAEAMMANPMSLGPPQMGVLRDVTPRFPVDGTVVYLERDFRNATAIALNAARFLNYLALIVRWPNNVGLHRLLLNEPLFLKALSVSDRAQSKKATPT
jgi:hypothetical protein